MSQLRYLWLLFFIFIFGCTNPFSQYFEYNPQMKNAHHTSENPNLEKAQGSPTIYGTNDLKSDVKKIFRKGYVLVGQSSFNGANINFNGAKDQAQKIGASIVLIATNYTNTASGAIPFFMPNPPQTFNMQHSGTVYGPGGYGTYAGSTSGQVSGGYQTHWMPYSVQRYDCIALYFAKAKKKRVGIFVSMVPDEIRAQIGKNQGLYVQVVVEESPAYYANVLEGDVLLELNGEKLYTETSLINVLRNTPEQDDLAVKIWRKGQVLDSVLKHN